MGGSVVPRKVAPAVVPTRLLHLPQAHIVILEFGSLALHLRLWGAEAVLRKLLNLPEPPLVAFLTVRALCNHTSKPTSRTVEVQHMLTAAGNTTRYVNLFPPDIPTAWSRAEDGFDHLCAHYGVGCVSQYRALNPFVQAHAANYSPSDVSADCLHPIKGRFGIDYFFDVLCFWFERTWDRAAASLGATPLRTPPGTHIPDAPQAAPRLPPRTIPTPPSNHCIRCAWPSERWAARVARRPSAKASARSTGARLSSTHK
jgi:hypothetical protein